MKYDFSFLSVNAVGEAAEYARELFSEEIELRAGYKPFEGGEPCVDLVSDGSVYPLRRIRCETLLRYAVPGAGNC